jgi:23S rRNA (uracil1939-C5)-methyltransferase
MRIRKGADLELTVEKMAYGGKGLCRVDGFVVFVEGGVPGDRVTARVFRKKKGYAEARILDLAASSPERVAAPCPYSDYCGGCQWQHVRYPAQLRYKTGQVAESLAHIGGLEQAVVRPAVPSPKQTAYRNKMEFSFSDRRWYPPDELHRREIEGNFALGLHVPGSFHKVIDVETCRLQPEKGDQILRTVKDYTRASGLPVYGLKSHQGFWRYLMVRLSRAYDQWMVNLVTAEENPAALEALNATLRALDGIATVVNNITRRKAAIAVGEREVLLSGKGYIEDRIGPYTFRISANSFFQTNPPVAEKLYAKVLEYADLKTGERVLDLYSGTGTISIYLADRAAEVTGLEISPVAVADARRNCAANNIDNCRFVGGDIRETLSGVERRPDVLIIDPPRAGMPAAVLARILSLGAEKIVYVSCNPATLARDLALMLENYEVLEIQPFDMFPHTYHIEAVVNLRRRKRSA